MYNQLTLIHTKISKSICFNLLSPLLLKNKHIICKQFVFFAYHVILIYIIKKLLLIENTKKCLFFIFLKKYRLIYNLYYCFFSSTSH